MKRDSVTSLHSLSPTLPHSLSTCREGGEWEKGRVGEKEQLSLPLLHPYQVTPPPGIVWLWFSVGAAARADDLTDL